MNFTYKCKFCGKEGVVWGDDEGLKMIKPEVWIPMIACERCADFMVGKRKISDQIVKICRAIETARLTLSEEKRVNVETKNRENLITTSKKFCALAFKHYGLTSAWDEEFANTLFEKPDKAATIISIYLRGLEKQAHSPKTALDL